LPSDELRERAEKRVGTTLRERYLIDRVLGVGGMAVVYAATHRNRKRFAIKMLHPELSIHTDAKQRFLREGYVANTVEHPGAVAVMDDDVADDGSAFIVMELLDGIEVGTLAEDRGGKLPLRVVLGIADQLLAVLTAAHDKEIVHRDLKPANLFLLRDGTLKVLDFGIARLREAVASGPSAATQTGALLGTPAFLPPEQAAGRTREVDAQTDLWAVGATLFTLLTGEYVHVAENATQIVIASATKPARSLAEIMPGAPPRVVALVDRALAFEKSARFANAAEMREAVRSAYSALFGVQPTRESLESLLEHGGAAAVAKTASVPNLPTRTAHLPQQQRAQTAPAVTGPAPAPMSPLGAGGTTAQPVSSTQPKGQAPIHTGASGRKASALVPLVMGGVLVASLAVGGTLIATRHTSSNTAKPDTTTPLRPEVAPVVTPQAVVATAAAMTAVDQPSTPMTQIQAPVGQPTKKGDVVSTHATHAPTVTASATATASAAPACTWVNYTDENGIPQIKKVCH
jgi:serine/threonine-protein kinase